MELKELFIKELESRSYIVRRCSICSSPLPLFAVRGETYINTSCDCVTYRTPDKKYNIDGLMNDSYHNERIKEFCGLKE